MKSNDRNLLVIIILILIIFIIIFNIDINKNKLNSRENFLINIYDDTKDKDGESLSDLIPCINDKDKEETIREFTKCRLGKKEDYFSCINGLDAKIGNCAS